ncbi:MAG: C1 family peptidase [Oscillochloridaceae bacterium]|nr:C1 family peptidase [Chloroflexaceae bacterium]MDW8388954.1 C1 family peptidase [Oscillochloridaceae bacterium]
MRPLTPLERIEAMDAAVRDRLATYWIASVEEFYATVRSSNQQYGTGVQALAVALELPEERVRALAEAALPLLPEGVSFSVPVELEVGAGLVIDAYEDVEVAAFAPPTTLPARVDPPAHLPPPGNQGVRNSCVAFTLAALFQARSGDPTDLSEQFLYWACKERDGIRGDVGTDPLVGVRVLQDLGICTETTWPYRPAPSDPIRPGHERPPAQAFDEARLRRVTAFRKLPAKGVLQIKEALAQGHPVLLGLYIWEHWNGSWQGRALGRVRFPLPGEARRGGHAVAVLGYRDDADAPGGGYFIARNSWGPDWGAENPDGPGYAHVPYRLVAESGLAAIAIEAVECPRPVSRPASGEPAPMGRAGLEELHREALALRADLQALTARVEALAARLGALAGAGGAASPGAPSSEATAAPAPPVAPAAEERRLAGGPLLLIRGEGPGAGDELYPNGLSPEGTPLLRIDAAAASELARSALGAEPPELHGVYRAKKEVAETTHLGVTRDIDPLDLAQARWAVVINATESAELIKAIWPLIAHRMAQMGLGAPAVTFVEGESAGAWVNRHTDNGNKNLREHWGQIPPVLTYRPNERAGRWLARHGVSQGPVDPRRGVPYYLLLLGLPGPLHAGDTRFIPFTFQYELDLFWAVGRLCFTGADGDHRLADYAAYAERLAGFEQRPDRAGQVRKEVIYYATQHDMDVATRRSAEELARPLIRWSGDPANVPHRQGFVARPFVAGEAGRAALERIVRGEGDARAPALLFAACHGLGLPLSDARLVLHQGALVTQDWNGAGNVQREHWFAGEDLDARAHLEGTMALLFACYGAGCPDRDEFIFDETRTRPQVAPFPLIGQLPQRLLLSGVQAVIGHVERAWTYSFSGTDGARSQTQAFEDVIARLLQGEPAGNATDDFNIVQGARAMALTEELENIRFGKIVDPLELAQLWVARNDARNYALLGDPAARLPW